MKTKIKTLLLVGSPKPISTSEILGSYLLDLLGQQGISSQIIRITTDMRSQDGRNALLSAVGDADMVILASPLYVDSLPSPVVRAMELVAAKSQEFRRGRRRFLAIINCGFPEAKQNDTALEQCRIFCRRSGMEWTGGLGLGGGQAIDGHPLEDRGWMVRNVEKALRCAAAAILEDRPLPPEVVSLMARPLIPVWLYLLFGDSGWKRQAKKFGVLKQMDARPFQKSDVIFS